MTTLAPPVHAAVSYRHPEMTAAYRTYRDALTVTCSFCGPYGAAIAGHLPAVDDYATMLVVRNQFPYSVWESQPVTDHLMIVPARHFLALSDMTGAESGDYWAATRDYEQRGYSVYTRSQTNLNRSVGHVHTHLIRTTEATPSGSGWCEPS